jgi:tetratricopeptide (TPR) repeat protein
MKKVCVYAIAKNESQFVDRWIESFKEADLIVVGDTGSEDDTVKKLKKHGVKVYKINVTPWRFDKARNEVLKKIPQDIDICLSVDLDEVAIPGWKKYLEAAWNENTTRLKYNYNWSFDKYGNPAVSFLAEKAHSRQNYTWIHPVHEVLKYTGDGSEQTDYVEGFEVNHYPDPTKSRSNYLPLLEQSVEEDPEDDRNMHYLGREYMFNGRWNECIDTLIKHLSLKSSLWKDERCASMRYIARCYTNLDRYDEARMWLDKAIIEAPYLREPYVERALLEDSLNNYPLVIAYAEKALEIKQNSKTYISEPFSWNSTLYDILSIAYFYTGNIEKSLENINIAIDMDPDNQRIKENKIIIEKAP